MKDSYIGQAWLVIVLCICFGAALAGVQASLSERIEGNKQADIVSQIPALVPGAKAGAQNKGAEIGGRLVYPAKADGKQVGWVIRASGQGFADIVEVLIGLDLRAERITGLYVLDQKETPGLGDRIRSQDWRGQFAGKKAGNLQVTKGAAPGESEIQAITGATISSQSVADIVNKAVAELRSELSARAAKD